MKQIDYKSVPGSPGGTAIAKYGDFLYTAGDSLCVYDIGEGVPKLVKKMHGFGSGRQLAVSNGNLYLTARNFGLWILSLKDPASPKRIARFDTVELATGLTVVGNMVFVSERIFGIEIIDCSDPAHPKHCAIIRTDEAQSAVFHNGILYAGEWGTAKLSAIDVSNPYHPKFLCQYPLGGYGDGVDISGDLCCAATGLNRPGADSTKAFGDGHGLEIFRLTERGRLHHIARLEFPELRTKSCDFWTVRICGKTAFAGDTFNGVFQVDLTSPEKPEIVGHFDLPERTILDAHKVIRRPDAVGNLVIGRGMLYVIGVTTGLHYAKIAEADESGIEPEKPFRFQPGKYRRATLPGFKSIDLGGQVRRISADAKNNRLFAACSHGGIKILDADGKIVGGKSVRCSYDVVFHHGKLYSAEGVDGFAAYEVEGDTLHELGRLKNRTMFQLIHISANGRFAICGERSGILRFLDIRDEKHIFQTRRHWHGGLLYGDTLPEYDCTNLIPVIWPYAGSAWYDLSGEKVKIVRNDLKDRCSGQCEGITWHDGEFLQTTIRNTLRIIPAESLGKVYQEIPLGFTGVPSVCGNIIAFAHRRNGDVQVGKIAGEKIVPIPERSFTGFAGFPDRVVFLHGKMIIPCGWQGLLIEK
ncbi:hypothetical protein MR060_01420 [bacterium]|nr:hypothetical protein [bacterium]